MKVETGNTHQYAKLFRFTEPKHMLSPIIVAWYDKETNIVHINKDKFARLTPIQQEYVLRTEEMVIDSNS